MLQGIKTGFRHPDLSSSRVTVPGWMLGLGAAVVLIAAACGGDDSEESPATGAELDVERTIELEPGGEPVALAVDEDGNLVVGERLTGRVRVVADGELAEPIAEVAVQADADDQRGLLGLAVDGERIYGAWTRAGDSRIVVGELTDGGERLVWEGPPSADRANGGHLAVLPDGLLVVGIGDLLDPAGSEDPDAPNGKLLTLDPDGPSNQEPNVLSSGWNNPFAFTVTPDGAIWVADNSPGDAPERIGRGDLPDAERTALPGKRAPSALVLLESGKLGLCGYLDGELTVVDANQGEPQLGESVATGCRTGAIALGNGRLAVSDGEQVHILLL